MNASPQISPYKHYVNSDVTLSSPGRKSLQNLCDVHNLSFLFLFVFFFSFFSGNAVIELKLRVTLFFYSFLSDKFKILKSFNEKLCLFKNLNLTLN